MVNLSAIIFIVTKGIVKQDNQTGNVMETTTFPKETSAAVLLMQHYFLTYMMYRYKV